MYRVVRNLNKNEETTSNSHEKGEAVGVVNHTSNINSTQQPSRPNDNMVDDINLVSLRNSFESLMEKDKILDVNDNPTPVNEALEDDEEEVE
ncbi:hypothetical protein Tco_1541456 [Tanacetum coccineum]